jgi:hypothetical protein
MNSYQNYTNFKDAYNNNAFSRKTKMNLKVPMKKQKNRRLVNKKNQKPWEPKGHGYQNYSTFDNKPPKLGQEFEAFYDDDGLGVPPLNESNMTIQDIYRTPFLFIQEHRNNYGNMAKTALKGIHTESDLSRMFFSDKNIKRLQKKIKKAVFERTDGQFLLEDNQEQRDLFIAMRAVYMEHSRFLENQIVRQIKRLNLKVVDEIVPGIITNIKQYYGYLKEINKPLDPIMRPMNTNNAGRRTLPSVSSVWK